MLNVGIIGFGRRARSHIPVLQKLNEKYRLAAICDIDESRAKTAAEETKAKPYKDLEKMLSKEKLDACLIAVQAEGHHIVARTLAERGIHIITETPIAITVACADRMIETAKENGVIIEVSENLPRWPHERVKQKIVADNLLGEIKEFFLSYCSGSYHGFAGIRSILKSEVKSVIGEFPSGSSIPERGEIQFLNGVKGIYEFNRNRGNYWEIIGTEGALRGDTMHLFKDDRRLRIEIEKVKVNHESIVLGAKVADQPEISFRTPFKKYFPASHDEVAIMDAWISLHEAIVNGKPLTYGAENARRDLEILIAIRDSATRGGVKVHLPLKSLTEHEKQVHAEFAKVYGYDPLEESLRDLSVRYTLPDRLRELIYYGRIIKNRIG